MTGDSRSSALKRLPLKYMLNSVFLLSLVVFLGFFILKSDFYLSYGQVQQDNKIESSKSIENIEVSLNEIMQGPITLKQDNHKLIDNIRQRFLNPPSKDEYNLEEPERNPSMGQSAKIIELLGEKKNGFFIECGALDGETRSNSLIFEKKYGWQGVLIEGDPKNYNLVLHKHRKSYTVPACLSTLPYPNSVMFQQNFNIGKISNVGIGENKGNLVKVQCLPIYSILLALNTTKVDYFSLDVEGHELEVLKTIPWEKVNITTLSVEFIHGKDGKDAMEEYMLNQGYKVHSEVRHPGGLANDFIFFDPKLLNN